MSNASKGEAVFGLGAMAVMVYAGFASLHSDVVDLHYAAQALAQNPKLCVALPEIVQSDLSASRDYNFHSGTFAIDLPKNGAGNLWRIPGLMSTRIRMEGNCDVDARDGFRVATAQVVKTVSMPLRGGAPEEIYYGGFTELGGAEDTVSVPLVKAQPKKLAGTQPT